MARSKWIPFVPQPSPSQNTSSTQPANEPTSTSADSKKFGLENFGNTCYANSVIQALYFCAPFRELLLQQPDSSIPPLPPAEPTPSTPAEPPAVFSPVRRKPERKYSSATAGGAAPTTLVTQASIPPIPSSPPTLFSALRSLFLYISTNPAEKGSLAPRAFIEKLKDLNESFRSTMHQDAHEFLNYLLNRIVEEVEEDKRQKQAAQTGNANGEDLASSIGTLPNAPPTILTTSSNSGTSPQDATLVHKLFEGVLTSETRCLSCETVSSRDESFLDLSIDIEQNSSVTACLKQFSASEMLCRGNKFSCDACGGLQEAEKRMKIKKLPNILALHLKRFKYQEDVQKYIKLTYRVAFPFELRLPNTVDDIPNADRLFNLFAIVIHIGAGPHHGHYISIIKTLGNWLVFDDEHVSPISEADIPKYFGESNAGSAYVLYYQAADIDLVELGLRTPSPPPPEPTSVSVAAPGTPVMTPSGLVAEENVPETVGEMATPTPPVPASPLLLPTAGKPSLSPSSLQITVPESASSHTSSTSGSIAAAPPTPTKTKGLFGIRRTPSSNAGKGMASTPVIPPPPMPKLPNGVASEKVPRTRASSPALSKYLDRESPPPLPSPALIQASRSTGSPHVPIPNGKDKAKKDPEHKSTGWFKKRKSFRLGDRDKDKDKDKDRHVPEVPSSPSTHTDSVVSSTEDHSSTHSNWFRSSGHQLRDRPNRHQPRRPSETGIYVDQPQVNGAGTAPRPKSAAPPMSHFHFTPYHQEEQHRPNGYDATFTSEPVSFSSSPYSSPGLHGEPLSAPSQNGPMLEFPPARKESLNRQEDDHPSELSRTRPKLPPTPTHAQRPSTAGPAFSSTKRQLPPIPSAPSSPTQESPHQGPLANGTSFSAAHGVHDDKFAEAPDYTGTESSTSLSRQGAGTPVASSSPSVAGHSTTSSSGMASGMKRTTRKLSLTAPILGFGRRDKDKGQHKERDKAPSAFGMRFS